MADEFSCESCGADIQFPAEASDQIVTCHICGFQCEVPGSHASDLDAGFDVMSESIVESPDQPVDETLRPHQSNSADTWDPFAEDTPFPTAETAAVEPDSTITQPPPATANDNESVDELFELDDLDDLSSRVTPTDDVFSEPLANFDESDLSVGQYDETDTSDYSLAPPAVEVIELSDRVPGLVLQLVPSDRVLLRQIKLSTQKAKAAIDAYARGVNLTDVLALFDNSASGDGSEGFLLTKDSLYMSPQGQIQLTSIASATAQPDQLIELTLHPNGTVTLSTSCLADREQSIVDLFNRFGQINQEARAVPSTARESHFATLIRHLFPDDRTQLFHRSRDIPQSALFGAIASFGQGARADEVLAVYDSSFSGDGGSGLLLTDEQLCFRNDAAAPPQQIKLLEIAGARAVVGGATGDKLELTLANRAKIVINMNIGKKKLSAVAGMFNQISQRRRSTLW